MRVALVAPLFETVPPTTYGGTERVLETLINNLNNLGHDVTLYTVGGSKARCRLVETLPESLGEAGVGITEPEIMPSFTAQLRTVFADVDQYDVVHIHHELRSFHTTFFDSIPNISKLPILWTDHVNLNLDFKVPIFEDLTRKAIRFTGLSDMHRKLAPPGVRISTVYNGIPSDSIRPTYVTPIYAAFLGRLAPQKGTLGAIRIAAGAGMPLKLAGPMTEVYTKSAAYTEELKALIKQHNVDYVGEVNDQQKPGFLSGAKALLFPILWDEPFGLVVIEAMACGTPVVAFRRGAVQELVEEGVTGFVVDNEAEAVEALKKVDELDRVKIRESFERRFTGQAMAEGYVRLYELVREEKGFKPEMVNGVNRHGAQVEVEKFDEELRKEASTPDSAIDVREGDNMV